ncbi:unnamed protein product [Timema podura]|uniref:Uncharacterized protein n=1 Tax=Timema podura TaxID=61482 RepID=A0ABN7PJU6_TIMPD|nr:unnamed protein product [Timema podura]
MRFVLDFDEKTQDETKINLLCFLEPYTKHASSSIETEREEESDENGRGKKGGLMTHYLLVTMKPMTPIIRIKREEKILCACNVVGVEGILSTMKVQKKKRFSFGI